MISKQPKPLQPILELNRSFDASASLYCFVAEAYPQVFYQNLSKKSQGSLFVSLFNFQGPLPLKERACCILPHHRRFVNTFFQPVRFFSGSLLKLSCAGVSLLEAALWPAARRRLCSERKALCSRALDYIIKSIPLCQLLFLLFSPLLYTPPRVASRSPFKTAACMNFPAGTQWG